MMSSPSHMHYFTQFVISLIGDFERYIRQANPNYETDGMVYRQVPMYLTDDELQEMYQRLRNVVKDYAANPPSPEGYKRNHTTILIPDPKE